MIKTWKNRQKDFGLVLIVSRMDHHHERRRRQIMLLAIWILVEFVP
jgi:hypothetical protein